MLKKIIISFLITLALVPSQLSQAKPNDSDDKTSYIQDLNYFWPRSELIVKGRVIAINQGTRATDIKFIVEEVYKGIVESDVIAVHAEGGSIIAKPLEPQFRSRDRAILFLVRDFKDRFVCLDGGSGKKSLVNDNVYFDFQDHFKSVQYDDYIDGIKKMMSTEKQESP